MVTIFTDTTSLLSAEFVATFPTEKLAVTLFQISQNTGVEFSQSQKSYSIIGDWSKVTKAHARLEEYFEKEQRVQQEEQKKLKESVYQSPTKNVGAESRRGRKPGCTVAKSPSSVVPEPHVQYHDDEGLPVTIKSNKNERNSSTLEGAHEAIDHDEMFRTSNLHDEAVEESEGNYQDTMRDINENAKNSENGEAITIKEEFDVDALDEDTDIDEQYLQENVTNPTASKYANNMLPTVEVKIEIETSGDEDIKKSNSGSKSKQKKIESKQSIKRGVKKLKKSLPKKTLKGESVLSVNSKNDNKKKRKNNVKCKEDTDIKEYKCDKCEYVGKKRDNLKEHMKRMHRSKFQCEVCKKKFGLHKDLLRHTRHVHTNPAYHCNICHKYYKFNRAYKEHMLSHEENYVKPQFECDICNKVFSTKYVLSSHVKSEHLGIKKSFLCPTCGRSFTQKNSYLMHANVHAGIKPYVCDVCGKAFSYDKSLKEHKYMHDDERRFSCDICAKAFRQKTSLLMHMKVHKDARDYICTACGKGFTQKQALLRHERIHSGDKPFKCALCLRSFNDYSIIRRHMMMHHKRDKDPKAWRGDIICSLKRKTEFYIEGGPGFNGGERLPTVDADMEEGTSITIVDPAVDENSEDHSDNRNDITKFNEDSLTKILATSRPVSETNSGSLVPSNTLASLPHSTGIQLSYSSVASTSETVSKLQETDANSSPSLPINYSIPPNFEPAVQSVPVTSGDNSESEDIGSRGMIESYRMSGPRREMIMQNLSSVAPLPALSQNHQFHTASGETTQGQPLPNPWNLVGYPHYYSVSSNFPHYQGPQN